MTIIRNEFAGSLFGIEGRFHNVVTWDNGVIANQKFGTVARPITGYGNGAQIRAEIRFDDSCRNGRESFAITGEVISAAAVKRGRAYDRDVIACGCIHDDIARAFPELVPLIKWHLSDKAGPMHYAANAVYLAGDRDHSGRRKGEPASFERGVRFGANPIFHKLKKRFADFLESAAEHPGRSRFDFKVIRVDHDKRGAAGEYQFAPHFTFGGYAAQWHDAPFSSEREALEFLGALQTCNPQFVSVATMWSEGKARELDAARRVAVWPDATDAELSVEPAELKAKLTERLPGLVAAFKADMIAAGFIWESGNE